MATTVPPLNVPAVGGRPGWWSGKVGEKTPDSLLEPGGHLFPAQARDLGLEPALELRPREAAPASLQMPVHAGAAARGELVVEECGQEPQGLIAIDRDRIA